MIRLNYTNKYQLKKSRHKCTLEISTFHILKDERTKSTQICQKDKMPIKLPERIFWGSWCENTEITIKLILLFYSFIKGRSRNVERTKEKHRELINLRCSHIIKMKTENIINWNKLVKNKFYSKPPNILS